MKFFILCFFICCSNFCIAQNGSVTYIFIYNTDSANIVRAENELYFNRSESTYYMGSKAKKETKEYTESREIIRDDEDIVKISITDTIPYAYYRNLKSNTFFCLESTLINNLKSKYFVYEDNSVNTLPWVLSNDYKMVSGYNCQKATVNFRGRVYEAWFTTEIPLPYGPWKLVGLPGLILEAYDLSKEVSFTAEKIIIPNSKVNKKIFKPKGIEISHKEFVELKNNRGDKVSKAILARFPKGAKILNRKSVKKGLELEYDWSKE